VQVGTSTGFQISIDYLPKSLVAQTKEKARPWNLLGYASLDELCEGRVKGL
jgi:hypothetical protein